MRHFRTIILLTVLACTVSTTKSFAHDIEAVNADGVTIYYIWTNNQTELAVSYRGNYRDSYSNEYTDNVVIPESVIHNGTTYSVTSIGGGAFGDCSGLTSVAIPNSVTSIGNYAFSGCSSLTSVTIPNSVTNIMAYAFSLCSGLTSFTILNPMTSIGSFVFSGCSGLMSIKVRVTDYTAFCNNTHKSSNKPLTLIDEDGQEITRFVIPDDVTSIEQSAFYDCSGLTSITIPNSVTSIGQSAFAGCIGLTSVTIPNSVTSIGESAFSGCTSLESVTIGDGVLSIDGNIFGNHCPAKIIWLSNTPPSGYSGAAGRVNYVANDQYTQLANKIVYKFLSSIFEVDGMKYVPVSPSERTCDAIDYINDEQVSEVSINATASYQGINMKVLNVQPFTFYQNTNVQKIILDIAGRIEKNAFDGCKNIEKVELGKNITSIGEYAFNGCSKLETIIVPDSVLTLGQYAFSGCTNMTSAIVGDGTKTIEAHAFSDCTSLTSAIIGDSTRFIRQYAFSGCTLLPTITIPGSVRLIDDYAFNGCKSLKEIIVKANNTDRRTTSFDPTLVQLGGSKTITIDVAKDEELSFNYQSWQGSITISFLGKDIPHSGGTFKQIFNKDGKISITLKTSNKPGYNSYCNITNMKLIESGSLLLGSNGNSPIFADCPLDTVFIDRDLAYRSESNSGYSPFYNNKFLRSVVITNNGKELSDNEFFGCSNLQNVQIGDGVTTIGDKAFSGCSGLKSFSFGTNVSNIGKEAFSDCTALIQLISHAATPPTCGSQALDDINKWTCKLTVPQGCLNSYQSADQWKDFFFIEEGDPLLVAVTGLLLNKKTSSFYIGESDTLTVSYTPENTTDRDIEWSSSDESIAVVDNSGVVTGKKGGIASIIVRSVSNPEITASCEVIVRWPSIALNKTSTAFPLGEKDSLTVIFTPENIINQKVEWSSTDETIAIVDENGVVTGKTKGSVTITAKYVLNPEIMASCEVTVQSPIIIFADAVVKAICVERWDTNGDGKLNEKEAAAVIDLGTAFRSKSIHSFDELKYFTGLSQISSQAFSDCSSLESIIIPDGVKNIGARAFSGCSKLASVNLPQNITVIEE